MSEDAPADSTRLRFAASLNVPPGPATAATPVPGASSIRDYTGKIVFWSPDPLVTTPEPYTFPRSDRDPFAFRGEVERLSRAQGMFTLAAAAVGDVHAQCLLVLLLAFGGPATWPGISRPSRCGRF